MILIKKAKPTKEGKKQFRVVNTGANGEPLKPSENLSSKQKAYGNILADLEENYKGCEGVWVKDETEKKPENVYCTIEVLRKKAGKKTK